MLFPSAEAAENKGFEQKAKFCLLVIFFAFWYFWVA
jgi:hypothetical protein